MSSSTLSNIQSNRWLYRCVHGHAHELKAGIRKKYTQIEQLRLESGFGLINDRNPGEWNWVPEADLRENGISWIKVKDKSCTLPSDDEIQEMCCGHVSPENTNAKTCEKEVKLAGNLSKSENSRQKPLKIIDTNAGRSLPKSNALLTPNERRNSVGREAGNAAFKLPICRKVIPSRFDKAECRHPDTTPNPKTTETKNSGIMKRAESSREQIIEREQSNQKPEKQTNGPHRHHKLDDDIDPEIVVVTMEEVEEISDHIPPGIHPKRREDCVHESSTEPLTPAQENARLLEKYKLEHGSRLPDNLTLLTYYFEPPIQTYKKKNDCFYKDIVPRFVPIIKVKILGLDVEYEETAIVDIGCDLNIAPQLGFSKKMTRDVVICTYDRPEDDTVQLRWRKVGKYRGSQLAKIELKPESIGFRSKRPFCTKLVVAQSFEMSHLVLGYTFVRPYVPAIDFDQNHLYLIGKEEENSNIIYRFDIEKWTLIDEVICRLENPPKVFLRSSATKLKLYSRPNHQIDQRWYPVRNNELEEVAPATLRNRYNIPRFDFCDTAINYDEFSLVPEDERYSYPSSVSGSTDSLHKLIESLKAGC